MKNIKLILAILVGLFMLGALSYAAVAAFEYLNSLYVGLEPQIAHLTMIVSIVAVICALIIASRSKTSSINSNYCERINLYHRLLVLWSERVKGASGSAEYELLSLEQLLALHGTSKVITSYINLRRSAWAGEKAEDEIFELLMKLLIEMRADLGQVEFNLDKSDLLDLLLNRHEPKA